MGLKRGTAKTLRKAANSKKADTVSFIAILSMIGGGSIYADRAAQTDTMNVDRQAQVEQVIDDKFTKLDNFQNYDERARIDAALNGTQFETKYTPEDIAAVKTDLFETIVLNPDLPNDVSKRYMQHYNQVAGADTFTPNKVRYQDSCRIETKPQETRLDTASSVNSCMKEQSSNAAFRVLVWAFIIVCGFPFHQIPTSLFKRVVNRSKRLKKWENEKPIDKRFGRN